MQMPWGTLKDKIPFAAVVSFIAGLVIGLVVLGWWLWPVQYRDTDPHSLRERHKIAYIEMVADSYIVSGDLAEAQARLRDLEGKHMSAEDVKTLVAKVAAERKSAGQVDEAARLQKLASAIGAKPLVSPVPSKEATKAEPTKPKAEPTKAPSAEAKPLARSKVLTICLGAFFVVLIVVGALLIWSYLRGRRGIPRLARRAKPPRPAPVAVSEAEEAEKWPKEIKWDVTAEAQPTLGHFVTTFELGDDGYDESFGIETETGEFLGECGVAISELIGSGAPEKPIGFDVWLFDKSDIRTVTKVVVSPYANQDDGLRTKLGAKGEVVVAEEGGTFTLETAALRVRAQIVDLAYGAAGGDLPSQSYFSKFTVELTPSRKTA